MSAAIRCKCGRSFKVKPHQEGKRFPCPYCGATLEFPRADAPAAPAVGPTTPRPPSARPST